LELIEKQFKELLVDFFLRNGLYFCGHKNKIENSKMRGCELELPEKLKIQPKSSKRKNFKISL